MAQFNAGVLTSDGLDLLAQAQAGEAEIKFSKFAIGDGEWEDTSQETLMAATELLNQRQEFDISTCEYINDQTVRLTMTASNEETETGFYIRELGVFATDGTTEILYAIYTATEDAADWFPAYNSVTPSSVKYTIPLTVANASEVTIYLEQDYDVTTSYIVDEDNSVAYAALIKIVDGEPILVLQEA